MGYGARENTYSNRKLGRRKDLNNLFVRSSWEANYARYLNLLKQQGHIKGWEYEAERFMFEKVKRGTRSYCPDFQVTNNDDTIEYHEVKGWMTATAKTALRRMKKYYPEVKLILIDSKRYKVLNSQLKNILPHWEKMR